MLVYSVDQAKRCGIVLGPPGSPTFQRAYILARPGEPYEVACANLASTLLALFKDHGLPDVFGYEAPIAPAAFFEAARQGKPWARNTMGVVHGWMLSAAMQVVVRLKAPECKILHPARVSVVREFTGRARWADKDENGKSIGNGREQGKLQVIATCRRRGLVDPLCADEDICDAIAQHFYLSSATKAKGAESNFELFKDARITT